MDTEKRTPCFQEKCMNQPTAGLESANPLLEPTGFTLEVFRSLETLSEYRRSLYGRKQMQGQVFRLVLLAHELAL